MLRVLAFLMIATPCVAQSYDCTQFDNADDRRYCRAVTMFSIGECAAIMDHDLRVACQAELSGDPGKCVSISDPDQREECKFRAVKSF